MDFGSFITQVTTNTLPKTAPSFSPIPLTQIWKKLYKDNLVYWACLLVFFLTAGFLLLKYEQGSLLLFFSSHRSEWGDLFFRYITKVGEEPAYILFFIFFLFIRYRYALLVPLTGLLVTIVSSSMKQLFLHPRPSVYYRSLGKLEEINLIEQVYLLGGPTSFPSGHTMSGFAIFTLVALLIPQKKGMAILLFGMALLVGISRIYLVQHFLKDIYLGAIMGVGLAILIYIVQERYPIQEGKWWDNRLKRSENRE